MRRVLRNPATLAFLVALLGFRLQLRWPIIMGDADVWWHIGAGQYIVDHRALPGDSFFSFLSPPRLWVDYYWLFQLLVNRLYALSGYLGLVVLRSCLYLLTSAAALLLLLERRPGEAAPSLGQAAVAAFYPALLAPRDMVVRPHIFTYLFIALSLYILERHPRRSWWLIPLGVLWANVHGITYLFLWLIVGAYVLEAAAAARFGPPGERRAYKALRWPAGLALASALATPYGVRLLKVPFMPLGYTAQAVQELNSVWRWHPLTGAFTPPANFLTFFVLIAVSAGAAACVSIFRRPRVSHLLLFAGGVFSLCKGTRFIYEFALLSLPLVASLPLPSPSPAAPRAARWAYAAAAAFLLALPVAFLRRIFTQRPQYPFSHRGLPQGVANFLETVDAGGDVLNYPDSGSYLWFRIYPRYRIFMDMTVPSLFTPQDLFDIRQIYADQKALAQALAERRPAFVTVPLRFYWMKQRLEEHPEYALVFFDDAEALYADRRRFPEVASSYEIRELDPFALKRSALLSLPGSATGRELPRWLSRMLTVDPDCQITNQLAVLIYLQAGTPARALSHAEAIIRNYPEWPIGYALKKDVLAAMGRKGV